MTSKNYDKYIKDMLRFIKSKDSVYSEDIPNIDLYMDQVTTFMDDNLGIYKRFSTDKVLTKTMINNYSKCGILPPINKKKYNHDHMVLLLFVYYFKHVLSIPDIGALLTPIKDIILDEKSPLDIEGFLDQIMSIQATHYDSLAKQVNHTVDVSKDLFSEFPEEDREKLSIFTTAYLLSIQATAQKYIVTQLIDNYLSDNPKPKSKPSKKKEPNK